MADIIGIIEKPGEVETAVEKPAEVGFEFDGLRVERVLDVDTVLRGMEVQASITDSFGNPDVSVHKTITEEKAIFDLAFSGLRGNGVADLSLVSQVGLTKTYRVTTDSGDFYDMVLSDGNGISSTSYGEGGTITFEFTDGTSYTTPPFVPYVVDEIIDDSADSGLDKTWSITKIKQVIENSGKVLFDTTAGWNSKPTLVGASQVLYVYTDALSYDGDTIPRIKIGDGQAYLIDTPFLNEEEIDHINNQLIHVSAEDRQSWNNKVTTYEPEEEILLITKD